MKKLFSVVLVFVLVISLAACGQLHATVLPAETESTVATSATKAQTTQNVTTTAESTTEKTTVSSTATQWEDVKDFDGFKKKVDNDYAVTKKTHKDGVVEIKISPTEDPDTRKTKATTRMAIPTMPKTTASTTRKTTAGTTVSGITRPTVTSTTKKKVAQYTYTTGQKHTALPYTERYIYSILNEEQKSWYREIDKVVSVIGEKASFSVDMAADYNYYIYFAYMFDHPEYFFLGNTVAIMRDLDGTSDLSMSYAASETFYCSYGHSPSVVTDELRAAVLEKKAIFDAQVQSIISTIPANAPAVWKERLLYDRILLDSHYNLEARWRGLAPDDWTAYGVLVNKYGVCESYSEAFQVLCVAVGINCTGVVGTAGGGHKWNCVELDGEWYACDITFDDPIGGDPSTPYHYYFNLTSERMEELQHEVTEDRWAIPDCTGTKYDFHTYFGE